MPDDEADRALDDLDKVIGVRTEEREARFAKLLGEARPTTAGIAEVFRKLPPEDREAFHRYLSKIAGTGEG